MADQGAEPERGFADDPGQLVVERRVLGPPVGRDPAQQRHVQQGDDGGRGEDDRRRGDDEDDAGEEGREEEAEVLHRAVGDVGGGELLRGLRQQRQHRRLGRRVAADRDGEEPGEGEDQPRGAVERGDVGGGGEDGRDRDAAADQDRPAREAIAEQAGEGRGDRAGSEADQGDDADGGCAAMVEPVDAERDRERPGGEGGADPGDPENPEVAVAEIDEEGTKDRPDFPKRPLHLAGR